MAPATDQRRGWRKKHVNKIKSPLSIDYLPSEQPTSFSVTREVVVSGGGGGAAGAGWGGEGCRRWAVALSGVWVGAIDWRINGQTYEL